MMVHLFALFADKINVVTLSYSCTSNSKEIYVFLSHLLSQTLKERIL